MIPGGFESPLSRLKSGTSYSQGFAEFTKRQLNRRCVTEVMFDSYKQDQKDYHSIVDKLFNNKMFSMSATPKLILELFYVRPNSQVHE